jgi:hypothetical protein
LNSKFSSLLVRAGNKFRGGGGASEVDDIINDIENIDSGRENMDPCNHIPFLRKYLHDLPMYYLSNDEKNRITQTLTKKINQLKNEGNCENTGSEEEEPSAEPSAVEEEAQRE